MFRRRLLDGVPAGIAPLLADCGRLASVLAVGALGSLPPSNAANMAAQADSCVWSFATIDLGVPTGWMQMPRCLSSPGYCGSSCTDDSATQTTCTPQALRPHVTDALAKGAPVSIRTYISAPLPS
jgi:hypothetical protein